MKDHISLQLDLLFLMIMGFSLPIPILKYYIVFLHKNSPLTISLANHVQFFTSKLLLISLK